MSDCQLPGRPGCQSGSEWVGPEDRVSVARASRMLVSVAGSAQMSGWRERPNGRSGGRDIPDVRMPEAGTAQVAVSVAGMAQMSECQWPERSRWQSVRGRDDPDGRVSVTGTAHMTVSVAGSAQMSVSCHRYVAAFGLVVDPCNSRCSVSDVYSL